MKARLRIIIAASVGLMAGSPALAQETRPDSAAPAQNAVIGNPQLRNFSLDGTVTRAAPAPVQVEPPAREQVRRQPPPEAAEPTRRETASASPAGPAPQRREPDPVETRVASESAEPGLPELEITPAPDAGPAEPLLQAPAAVAAAPVVDPSGGTLPVLPWILAALALGGAAAWFFFLRQRPRESYAGAGQIDSFEAPPAPAPAAPRPVPAAPKATPQPDDSTGVVSTRLRPWLEIEFTPKRAVVDDQKAAVAFELSVINTGKVPARDVLLEASLFNAGPMQDQQIKLFFDNPVAKGDRIPVLPELQRIGVETAVFLPREQVRPIEIEGRSLFVPLIAFNILYSWGRGDGQTSASFLVGKQLSAGEKLAPFRLDLGPRIFRNLAAREHELRLRT